MQVEMKVTDPEDVTITLTVTAKLRDWRQVHGACSDAKCAYPLTRAISNAIFQVRNKALVSTDEEPGA